MAIIWKPEDLETYLFWVKTIEEEASDELTDWENNFIASISSQLDSKINLTERQAITLERIYANKTK
jgi:hypothetical protein